MTKSEQLETQQKILEAAIHEFHENGVSGARMQAIAERAGANKALLHYYFKNKEFLYLKVLDDIFTRYWDGFGGSLDEHIKNNNIRSVLEMITKTKIMFMYQNPAILGIMSRELAAGAPYIQKLDYHCIEASDRECHKIKDYFKQWQDAGLIRKMDPNHIFCSLFGMCMHTFLDRVFIERDLVEQGKAFDEDFLKERITSIVDILYHGLVLNKE